VGDYDDSSTTSDLPTTPRTAFERWSTRAGMLLLAAVVLAGAVGLLGPKTGEKSASALEYDLRVTYPSITRAGEPAPLHVRVEGAGGFDGPIQIALCDDYFDDLDFQNWYPNPSAETSDTSQLVYEFDPPDGQVFEVSLDARAAPGQFGEVEDCTVTVLEEDVEVVSVSFKSWRMP
jgi:hypothetical protein